MENNETPKKLHIITVKTYPTFIESMQVLSKDELFDYCKDNGFPIFKVEMKYCGVLEKTIYFLKLDDAWLYYEEITTNP